VRAAHKVNSSKSFHNLPTWHWIGKTKLKQAFRSTWNAIATEFFFFFFFFTEFSSGWLTAWYLQTSVTWQWFGMQSREICRNTTVLINLLRFNVVHYSSLFQYFFLNLLWFLLYLEAPIFLCTCTNNNCDLLSENWPSSNLFFFFSQIPKRVYN